MRTGSVGEVISRGSDGVHRGSIENAAGIGKVLDLGFQPPFDVLPRSQSLIENSRGAFIGHQNVRTSMGSNRDASPMNAIYRFPGKRMEGLEQVVREWILRLESLDDVAKRN